MADTEVTADRSGSKVRIDFSTRAREMILGFMGGEDESEYAVRVSVASPSPVNPRYEITLVDRRERAPEDQVLDGGGFPVLMDPESARLLDGARVEWVESLSETGFKVENPNLEPLGSGKLEGPLAERVRTVIEERVNPAVAQHGGRIGLVDVRDQVVYIRMSGGCQGCGMARVTLKQGVEKMIRDAVPEITAIEDVTDHEAGADPYYPR